MEIDIEIIKGIAQKAGAKIIEYYGGKYEVSNKENNPGNPLTEADLASNKIILAALEKYGLPILSEEKLDDEIRLKSEYIWIVDPLDGTSDFVEKTDEFSVMIALVRNKQPILGVVFEPAKKTFYWAEKDEGAFMEKNGKIVKIQVSTRDNFKHMAVLLSRNHLLNSDIRLCNNLEIGRKIKRGSTSKMCVIARGDAEIYVNTSDKTGEWDTCAVQIILEEAGGRVTNLQGDKLVYNKKIPKNLNGFVASNGRCHGKIIEELRNIL